MEREIQIFQSSSESRVIYMARDWAKTNNLKIISASLAIERYDYSPNIFYLTVVFEKNKKGLGSIK